MSGAHTNEVLDALRDLEHEQLVAIAYDLACELYVNREGDWDCDKPPTDADLDALRTALPPSVADAITVEDELRRSRPARRRRARSGGG